MNDPIVITSAARTPIGNLLGELKDFSGHALGSIAIAACISRAGLKAQDIQEVIMGCVLPAGQGQAPARQASIGANIPTSTPCTTINKVCGSGMKAVMFGHDILSTNAVEIMIAGGMESMTNAPHLLTKARVGYRLGQGVLYDHMLLDGLEDAYDKGQAMGVFAEACATKYHFSRQAQDDFSISSFARAKAATEANVFANEIVPITLQTKTGDIIINKDEHPFSVNPEKIPTLKAAFVKEGTITAGNASSIADGAAALSLMRESIARKKNITPLARIIGHVSFAKAPQDFTTAPIDATRALLKKINWQVSDVDLFEINEAFAVVALAFMHDLKIPHEKVNIYGGGVALGHPIGATGARIIVTLLNALKLNQMKRGIATLCIGGGEATAVAFELI